MEARRLHRGFPVEQEFPKKRPPAPKSNFIVKRIYTKIEFDADAMLLHGKIEGISDLVTFESQDASQIEHKFHSAVDNYLDFCEEVGKSPEKEYRGLFNVRIQPELHKRIVAEAMKRDMTINAAVEQAIQMYVNHAFLKRSLISRN